MFIMIIRSKEGKQDHWFVKVIAKPLKCIEILDKLLLNNYSSMAVWMAIFVCQSLHHFGAD